ncbi:MAG: T9SS type A sorting domain-containing protein [Bacteroidota bacterium]
MMTGIAYGNSVYAGVGSNGYIVKSTDGINWSVVKTSSFISTNYTRIAFGNSVFVAVTGDGKVVTSPDAVNWTQRTSGTTNSLNDIIYANSKFIAVGDNNTAITSTDGITWSAVSIGAGSTDLMRSIVYGTSKFVIGVRDATGARSYYSTTGNTGTWSNAAVDVNSLNNISYFNDDFFCFTASLGTSVFYSTNGSSWSTFTNSRLSIGNQVFHGLYDAPTYYMFGSSSENGYGSVFTSTNGTTFTLQPQSTTLTNTQFSRKLNGMFFMGGNESFVYSANGSTWKFPAGSYLGIAYSGSRYVAVGQVTSNEAAIFSSADFNTWTNNAPSVMKPLNGVAYGGGKFVAVGNVNASSLGTVATSSDGITWTVGSSGVGDNLRAVAYGNSKFVAVGNNGRIVYSADGTTWTSAESGMAYTYYSIGYVNGYFVAIGGAITNGATTKVKYSVNGTSWTDASPSIVGHFEGIAYGGGKYMLVGRDNTVGSQKFFSVTTADITSASGYSSPLNATTPEGDLGTATFGGVAYANSTFVTIANLKAAPFSAYILTSPNGTAWTATAANTTGRLRGIIATGSSFKAVGLSDTKLSIAAGAILPVHLNSFEASVKTPDVLLTWNTVNEENFDHFEVEHSEDGMSFSNTGNVQAKNTAGPNAYTFTAVNPGPGSHFYRLKMLDRDGRLTYSEVVKVSFTAARSISMYPNPAYNNITLSLPLNSSFTITVFNNKGQEVIHITGSGATTRAVDISKLSAGVYILKATQAEFNFTGKLIKK